MELKGITKSRFVALLAVTAVIAVIAWGAVTARSYGYYSDAVHAIENGRTLQAITAFERSALWYAPLNPYWEKSLERLAGISARLENENPLFANQAMNAADRVAGQLYPWGSANFWPAGEQVVPIHIRLLIHLLFAAWLASCAFFCFAGFKPDGQINSRRAVGSLSVSFIVLASWLYLLAL